MKSNLIFSTLLSASFLFVSCKKEEETSETTSDAPKEIIMPRVQAIPSQTTAQQPVQQNVTQVQNMPVNMGQTVTPTQTPVVTKKGMNPPHGQPGHRCDIAVGAPLNSPPGNTAQPKAGTAITQQINPSAVTTTQAAQPTGTPAMLDPNTPATAPGMNPPHGQPGHQCGIAVGAPLPKE